jgi:multifunctional 2-oxoglutarate metabolism enzyme
VENDDGSRSLLVPVIQDADTLTFEEFLRAYEELIRKIRTGKLDPAMFAGGVITITNPGTIGTVHSIPRLMSGQSAILGVGTIDYPAEYQAADERTLAKLGVGKVITLTSTYDHRVIQGAESGLYLARVSELLLGEDGFYDEVFASLGLPYEPARWRTDTTDVDSETDLLTKQMKVDQLANMYRVRGHLIADLDPLRQRPPVDAPRARPDLLRAVDLGPRPRVPHRRRGRGARMPLGEILGVLRDAYCRTIGIEYGHVLDPEEKAWIREQVEGVDEDVDRGPAVDPRAAQRRRGLRVVPAHQVRRAEAVRAGGRRVADPAARRGVRGGGRRPDDRRRDGHGPPRPPERAVQHPRQVAPADLRRVRGAHRPDTVQGSGDVKYHLGTSAPTPRAPGNTIELHLPPNPSHLEAVNPVVEGIARAMQDRYDRGDEDVYPALPLLMHGDAAFAGQGVVVETLNLSQLRGYRTGGTIHVVINNQVGFTTSPEESRSSFYATDVAKTVQAPILHVNGDDPEAVVRVARLAFEYRQRSTATS